MRNLPRVSHFPQDQYSVFCAAIQILQEFFKDFYNFLTYQLHSFEDQFLRNTLLLKFFLGCHILQGFSKKNEKQGKKSAHSRRTKECSCIIKETMKLCWDQRPLIFSWQEVGDDLSVRLLNLLFLVSIRLSLVAISLVKVEYKFLKLSRDPARSPD